MVKKSMRTLAIVFLGFFFILNSAVIAQQQPPPEPEPPDITVSDSIGSAYDLMMSYDSLTEGLSLERIVEITNDSRNTELVIGIIAQEDPLIDEFIILNDNCSGMTIAPSSGCTFTVRFSPATPGQFDDTFDIPSDDPDEDENPVKVTVSGTGLSSAMNSVPVTPKLVSPEDGQTGLGTTLQFRWEESTDPDGDNLVYSLHYCENEYFIGCEPMPIQTAYIEKKVTYFANTGIEFLLFGIALAGSVRGRRKIMLLSGMVIMSAIFLISCGGGGSNNSQTAPINEITQEISELNEGTTYYWKITADDGNGGLIESEVRSFTTQ